MTAPAAESADILASADTLRWELQEDIHQAWVEDIYAASATIVDRNVSHSGAAPPRWQRRLDTLLTGRWTGFPAMLLLFAGVLWLTIAGANVPSAMLATLLIESGHPALRQAAGDLALPWWLSGFLIDGVYLTTAWVISVMLPPMAIFFPLFTVLEDFGYLPRVAFNLDAMFRRAGAHGKQALTMCMGYGCNAAGVIATRIIDSPRERLIAIVTNSFALCNGRWPTQILVATVFLGALVPPAAAGLTAAAAVTAVALLGVGLTFLTSLLLSRTVLRGEASTFSLELPPYRPPNLLRTLYTSLIDRTIFVLWRAIVFALPAGALIWLIANLHAGDTTIAHHLVRWGEWPGWLLGLNGVIIVAFVVAIPANEIVIPTVLMLTVLTTGVAGVGEQGTGVMFETEGQPLARLLAAGGWTTLTAVCLMLFSFFNDTATTEIYTIWKETRSVRWTAWAALLPLAVGIVVCTVVAGLWRLLA
jgi:ferrous iron transport protein B